ncbi:DUF6382 domain-containing protein [Cohnella laeviribosi]|uniref:DUF6382 domain-containing protein n=1 Tax=Cohnella laeviribosi TaxID=380174 RepID=UPI0003734775|nr:DUF6382 domain-containing protein [Cohnella laeviribosi]
MNGYKVKFEQGRGHRMVLEGDPLIGGKELDLLQTDMLRACDVPGLLKLETEELDGKIALRYSLLGRRMLSQAVRASRWTMAEAVSALCRLADVLENGRDYMLDQERFVLDDDFIFVGEDWHDLYFTYLPVSRKPAGESFAFALERLIVRWMMYVDEPDGLAMRHLLRIAGSEDFSPAALRHYARAYAAAANPIAGREAGGSRETSSSRFRSAGGKEARGSGIDGSPKTAVRSSGMGSAASRPEAASDPSPRSEAGIEPKKAIPARAFSRPNGIEKEVPADGARTEGGLLRRIQTPANDPQSLSGLLGDGREEWAVRTTEKPPLSLGRLRTCVAAGASLLAAAAWRFVYLPSPDSRNLALSAGISLCMAGACAYMWNGGFLGKNKNALAPEAPASSGLPEYDKELGVKPEREREFSAPEAKPRFAAFSPVSPALPISPASPISSASSVSDPDTSYSHREAADYGWRNAANKEGEEWGAESAEASGLRTSWLPGSGAETALLSDAVRPNDSKPYLETDSGGRKVRIALQGSSLIIGRSAEIAQHVDETQGVSRAHLELIRQADGWRAKDLGSRNGSWINGKPMAPYELYPLKSGDSLQIASSVYRYNEM